MTAISAIFSNKGIAVATDSMLTAVYDGKNICLEWQKSKIITVPKLKACISYWGFAGVLKKIPKNDKETPLWHMQTSEWLKKESLNPNFDNLEDFSKDIHEKLKIELERINRTYRINSGIGLHITGQENVDGYTIPELFLVSNFVGTDYNNIAELSVSRHTNHTITGDHDVIKHGGKEYRFKVKKYLDDGGLIIYNNGDPTMFNIVSLSISKGIHTAKSLKFLKSFNSINDLVPIVKRPIEIISDFQKDFYETGKRFIGGRIHDLTIDNYGLMTSTSGDI